MGSRKPRPSGGHIGFSNMNREQKQSMKLEDLQANAAVHGILSDSLVTVVSVQWFGSEALELTYKTPTGKYALNNAPPYRSNPHSGIPVTVKGGLGRQDGDASRRAASAWCNHV